MHEELELTRDVEAIQIPSGDPIHLPTGTKVMITQALGGTYTVATQSGLARIKSENADALGIDLEAEKAQQEVAAIKVADGDVEGAIWEQLKLVFDPEIPVDIYELGLIYDVFVNEDNDVKIIMTLTTPNCPVAESLPQEVKEKVRELDEVNEVELELTFDPPWTRNLISEEAKLELGFL